MKAISHIASITLAMLILVVSSGMTINRHYCGKTLKSISINHKANPCPMCDKVMQTKHGQENHDTKGCCENEQEKVQTSDYSLIKKVEQQSISDFQLIVFSYVVLHQLYKDDTDTNSFTQKYSPPLIEHDIPVQVQSFLL